MGGERPWRVTLFALGVLGLAAYNLLGLWAGLEQAAFLRRLSLSVPLIYLLASRALWAAALAGLGLGLWRQMRRGRRVALVLLAAYWAHGWVDRLLFVVSDFSAGTWAFHLGLSLSVLGLAAVLIPPSPPAGIPPR